MEDSAALTTPEQRQKKLAVETLLAALVKAAKTVSLYKAGHPMIMQVVGRIKDLLDAAIGQEPNLPLELKAKQVLYQEVPLAETEEIVSFAAALHLLGVGQILLTNRVTVEGLHEFMKLIVAKPAEGQTLTDLQKAVQSTRIDGMQIIFILSFVVTGEADEAKRQPGQLTEEQVAAFIQARTLPDFLTLLLRQNEPLANKEAQVVTSLLDQVLNREIGLDQFDSQMPWSLYDPRIKERFDRLAGGLRGRKKWDATWLISETGTATRAEIEGLHEHHTTEAPQALLFALERAHQILENPAGDKQVRFAAQAYVRLLEDLGRAGNLDALFGEHVFCRSLETRGKLGADQDDFQQSVRSRVASPALAEKVATSMAGAPLGSDRFRNLEDFILWLGEGVLPMLLGELRRLADKDARKNFCSLMASICRKTASKDVEALLQDEDYFMVVQGVAILAEIPHPGIIKLVAPLLKHRHERVREAAVRTLGKFGGAAAADALAAFVQSSSPPEERRLAVTTLSLIPEPGIGERLVAAFEGAGDYDVQVGIATALGRTPGASAKALLERLAAFNWIEWLTGRNKALRQAAARALEEHAKEGATPAA